MIAKRNVVLLALTGGLLLAAGAWASDAVERLLRSIQPGAPNSASTSTEPYDLTFKIDMAAYDDVKDPALAEWQLRLPRAFVWDEYGGPEDIGGGAGNASHTAGLFALFDPTTEAFSPAVLAERSATDTEGFFIDVGNIVAGPKMLARDQCVRYGAEDGESTSKLCDDTTVRCRVTMHHHGWVVRVAMPKKYYAAEFHKYCGIVIKFLEEKTVAIDDLQKMRE